MQIKYGLHGTMRDWKWTLAQTVAIGIQCRSVDFKLKKESYMQEIYIERWEREVEAREHVLCMQTVTRRKYGFHAYYRKCVG